MAVTAGKSRRARIAQYPNKSWAGALTLLAAMLYPLGAHALDWKLQPSVNASASYSDNANHSDSDPEDAMIFTVMPGFSLTSEGSRRVRASLQYSLRGIARFGYNEGQDINHNLGATGHAEVVEDFFFIDGAARISQELISLFGSLADADTGNSNRATVGTYTVSPYIKKRLGNFANAEARYTNSGAIFENDVASNSNVNKFSAGLTSGTRFDDLSWGLNYSIRKADNRNSADTTFERAGVTLGYALTRKFRIFGNAGQDWNEYVGSTGTTSTFDGSFYSVGFGWAPTRRTSVETSAGERYFGRTYSFSGSHRTRQTQWTLRYSENVSDITQQFLEETSRIFWLCRTGDPVRETQELTNPDPGNCEGPVGSGGIIALLDILGIPYTLEQLVEEGLLQTSLASGVYIIKSLNGGVSWDIGRLNLGLSVYDTQRLFQALADAEDRVRGVTGSASYRLSPKTTANAALSFSRRSADAILHGGVARDDDIMGLTLGLSHRVTQDLTTALTFRHSQRNSNEANSDYQENRITGTVNMRF